MPQADGGVQYVELKGDVRLKDVDFGYVPEKEVLHKVSVYAKPGQKIAFVGSTGAGKTTITNLINRFYEIQSGSIQYDGIDVTRIEGLPPAQPGRRPSGTPICSPAPSWTTSGTTVWRPPMRSASGPLRPPTPTALSAASPTAIRPWSPATVRTCPRASASCWPSPGRRSGPPVMVLDEATSSIDTRTEALISRGMDALMENRTVFVIAHRLPPSATPVHRRAGGRPHHRDRLPRRAHGPEAYYQLYTGQFKLT